MGKVKGERMKVVVFDKMEEGTEAEVQRMLPLVSPQRREQALKYKHTFGQFCCLKSWLMLYEMLDEREKGLMDEWEYNEYGKPSFHLSPFTFHLYFSISHCKAGIAVAIDDQPVGIDIETIRHANEDLVERTMNEKERVGMDDRTFTRLWTQKEAIVKAEGTGIYSFEQLQTILDNGHWTLDTFEKDNYIYSIAYGQLCSFGA